MVAIVYWVEPASSLPGFFPGHDAGSDHHHVKHGIAALLVASPVSPSPGSRPGRGARRRAAAEGAVISYVQAIVLGLLQGVSELFPISSLGHSVILPALFGWDIHQNDDVLPHLPGRHAPAPRRSCCSASSGSDWVRIVAGLGRSLRDRHIAPDDTDAKLGWLLVVGTIPAGLLGLLLEHPLRSLFASPQSAAFFLMVNGLMLFGAERLRRRAPRRARTATRRADRANG